MRNSLRWAVAIVLLAGCGSDPAETGGQGGSGAAGGTGGSGGAGGVGGTSTATTGTGGAGGDGGGGVTCDDPPFEAVAEDAGNITGGFFYFAQSSLGEPVDVLGFELLDGQPPAASSLPITDAGYESCTNCVVVSRGCNENLVDCQKVFLADSGSLEVTASGGPGGEFSGNLLNAHFVEVEIDPTTYVSTVVPGGESFCWGSYAFSATIQ